MASASGAVYTTPAPPNSVYWVGNDGHTYVKTTGVAGGAQDYGVLPNGSTIFNSTKIDNPGNPSSNVTPPGQTGGSGSTTTDKSNDIELQSAGVTGADSQLSSGLDSVNKSLSNILSGYDAQDANASSQNTNATNTNVTNLQTNKQTALVNAAQGRQGLYATLASLGALNGSGITLATNAVQKGANEDLAGASSNFGANKNAIDTAYSTYTADAAERRQEAQDDAESDRESVTNTALSNKLAAYKALAGDYSDEGDKANAQKYTDLATSLIPQISSTSVPAPLQADTSVAYTAPQLSSYLAGNSGTNVSTTPAVAGSTVPGLIASNTKKKVTV